MDPLKISKVLSSTPAKSIDYFVDIYDKTILVFVDNEENYVIEKFSENGQFITKYDTKIENKYNGSLSANSTYIILFVSRENTVYFLDKECKFVRQ